MEEITLNLIPTGVRPTCHVSQNDNERNIKINLVNGSLAYSIQADDVIKLNVRKPNETVVSASVSATAGNTYIIANVTDDMCNIDGTNLCEVRITNGSTRISSSNFLMEVETDPSANGGGGGGGASNLSDLDDVNISNPSNGQVLKYNGTSEMWENGAGGGGGSESFADLTDVSLSNLQNGQVPKWNGTSQKWENADVSGASAMSDLTDVDLTGLEDGNSLVYDDDDDEWKVQTITKEVTQAEYDALVQAGTVDPKTAYFIKDTNGDGQDFQPVIYSLEEREIGVWTDGKPLYEKTIYYAGGVSGRISIAHGISNLGDVISAEGVAHDKGYNEGIDEAYIPFAHISNDKYDIGVFNVSTTNIDYTVPTVFDDRIENVYITLRYTKSTDQAGSGQWTPQGVPAVHYSTDEHVIGTWIDGKTLYEKVISITSDFSSEMTVNHGISNLAEIIDFRGTVMLSNGYMQNINDWGLGQPQYQTRVGDFNSTSFAITLGSARLSVTSKINVILHYTKSSS